VRTCSSWVDEYLPLTKYHEARRYRCKDRVDVLGVSLASFQVAFAERWGLTARSKPR